MYHHGGIGLLKPRAIETAMKIRADYAPVATAPPNRGRDRRTSPGRRRTLMSVAESFRRRSPRHDHATTRSAHRSARTSRSTRGTQGSCLLILPPPRERTFRVYFLPHAFNQHRAIFHYPANRALRSVGLHYAPAPADFRAPHQEVCRDFDSPANATAQPQATPLLHCHSRPDPLQRPVLRGSLPGRRAAPVHQDVASNDQIDGDAIMLDSRKRGPIGSTVVARQHYQSKSPATPGRTNALQLPFDSYAPAWHRALRGRATITC